MFNQISINKQKGAALIVLVLAFLMATAVLVITNFSIDKGKIGYEKRTSQALAKAKETLISYAVSYYEHNSSGQYGFLPCPEMFDSTPAPNEGNERGNCDNKHEHSIGRLPWKTLDIEPLKDGSGECLWYAVSGVYKNGSGIEADMHNEDSAGMFQIKDENNNIFKGKTPEERVVAVVIAPGSALAGQNRPSASPNYYCKVNAYDANTNIAEYLDVIGADDNASLDDPELLDTFVTAQSLQNQNINDRIITITQEEIFTAIRKSRYFQKRAHTLTEAIAVCVKDYTINNVVVSGGCDLAVCLQQCADDQTVCHDQCYACGSQCDLDYSACLLVDTKKNCDKALKNCNKACPNENKCVKDCDKIFKSCESDCNTNCTPGGGGNNFWLPWPAPVDLSPADYREDVSYDDAVANISPAGRLPYTLDSTNLLTGNPSSTMFENCTNIDATINGINGIDLGADIVANEYRKLWRHWKDHLFYAIGSGFDPSNATATATPDCNVTPASCVKVYDAATATTRYYAGVIVYSGSKTASQLRQSSPPELAAVPVTDSKGDLNNYLESYSGPPNNQFEFSSGSDSADIAYCISSNMVVTQCSP